jgi:NADPH:quinone reductase-like Zn-dependent oxidoreductase
MKAAVIREHGGPEVIRVEEVSEPQPGPREVAIEVRAGSLNHLDIWVRKGGRAELEFPHILGSDAAGVVAAVGVEAEGIEVGQEVLVAAGYGCGACEFCRQGERSLCDSFGIIGLSRPGVLAERAVVPAGNVVPKPAGLSFEQAACLGVAYGTAWRMLFTRARLLPGETVLIHGVGGGVALAALQFAVAAGARAIVTSSSDEKLAKARQMGAEGTINYRRTADVAAAARELTGGRGADVAFDAVGAATWPVDFGAVHKGGRVVLCGVTTGAEAPTNLQALYWNQLSVLGSTFASESDFLGMLRTVEAAGIEPAIDSVLPLERLADAHRRMEEGKQFGKIVVKT